MIKYCPKCNFEHKKAGLFCSRSCANSRGPRTDQFKKLVSKKLTGRKGKDNPNKGKYLVERLTKKCLTCNHSFLTTARLSKKYCSNECWKQKSGGYRPRSGRSKSGYYKGIYCGSTYELCWVIYHLDHNIKFSRFEGSIENQDLKYYPDFILDDKKTIIEIKGFEKKESVDKKTKLAESFGYIVKVFRAEDLEFAFSYVKETYTDKYQTLYDGYKPKYNYKCSHCKNNFTRDKKLKTAVVFCSRQCAGKGHKGRTIKSL
jgi:hypothetical protein